jgi:hypothetical protein
MAEKKLSKQDVLDYIEGLEDLSVAYELQDKLYETIDELEFGDEDIEDDDEYDDEEDLDGEGER